MKTECKEKLTIPSQLIEKLSTFPDSVAVVNFEINLRDKDGYTYKIKSQ